MAKQVMVMTGDTQLNFAINSLPIENTKRKQIITKAARKSVKVGMLGYAKRKAPKKTGELQRNLKVKSSARSRTYIGARLTSGMATGKGVTENTGNAYYGAFLLWGTKARFTRNRARAKSRYTGKVHPSGWLWEVVDKRKNRVMSIYARELRQNIIKAAKGTL